MKPGVSGGKRGRVHEMARASERLKAAPAMPNPPSKPVKMGNRRPRLFTGR
jgi:hypothetical protein